MPIKHSFDLSPIFKIKTSTILFWNTNTTEAWTYRLMDTYVANLNSLKLNNNQGIYCWGFKKPQDTMFSATGICRTHMATPSNWHTLHYLRYLRIARHRRKEDTQQHLHLVLRALESAQSNSLLHQSDTSLTKLPLFLSVRPPHIFQVLVCS